MTYDSTFQHLVTMEERGREVANPFGQAYGPLVKIVCKPAAAPSCDLVVMVKTYTGKHEGVPVFKWKEVARFNDMSDDFAHTNAHARAQAERRKILEGEA